MIFLLGFNSFILFINRQETKVLPKPVGKHPIILDVIAYL
jgi:hypothetical protein